MRRPAVSGTACQLCFGLARIRGRLLLTCLRRSGSIVASIVGHILSISPTCGSARGVMGVIKYREYLAIATLIASERLGTFTK